jgi:hypothetical protein
LKIRTHYWHARVKSRAKLLAYRFLGRDHGRYFRVGNAGDILTADLLKWHYGCDVVNCNEGGKRLLLIGSIGHTVQLGDVVCGIGTKDKALPPAGENSAVQVLGLRGPISLEVFKKAGYDVSQVRFLFDPGLLIRVLLPRAAFATRPQGAIFIPHYRERIKYQRRRDLPSQVRLVSIDDSPTRVAQAILGAELVYTSSLHGIIFSHALGRPCVFIRPQTEEPLLKYQDYFAGAGVPMPEPRSDIWAAHAQSKPLSPVDLRCDVTPSVLPTLGHLTERGVVVQ